MKLRGSKKVVCKCGKNNYLLPGTARKCSECGKVVRVGTAKKGR